MKARFYSDFTVFVNSLQTPGGADPWRRLDPGSPGGTVPALLALPGLGKKSQVPSSQCGSFTPFLGWNCLFRLFVLKGLGRSSPMEWMWARHPPICSFDKYLSTCNVSGQLSDFTFTFHFMHWRRKWQPTPVFLPGESQGRGSLVGCHLLGRTELDATEAT